VSEERVVEERAIVDRAAELLVMNEGTWAREVVVREAKKVIRRHEKTAE
jgi:hypothetical protein